VLAPSENTHAFRYAEPYYAMNVVGKHVPSAWSDPPTAEVMVIHHYLTKSKEDFQNKRTRGAGDGTFKVPYLYLCVIKYVYMIHTYLREEIIMYVSVFRAGLGVVQPCERHDGQHLPKLFHRLHSAEITHWVSMAALWW
jgi:hypothetical protein